MTAQEIYERVLTDRQVGPAILLLANIRFAGGLDLLDHIRASELQIDWKPMFDSRPMWSSGEQLVLDLAFNLWSGSTWQPGMGQLNVYELAWRPDRRVREAIILALRIAADLPLSDSSGPDFQRWGIAEWLASEGLA